MKLNSHICFNVKGVVINNSIKMQSKRLRSGTVKKDYYELSLKHNLNYGRAIKVFFTICFLSLQIFHADLYAQIKTDSSVVKNDTETQLKKFMRLEDALKNPQIVLELDLSDQQLQVPDSIWTLFTNLKHLSLRNDHLKVIPKTIGDLESLETLDISGNDFITLPRTFEKLINLKELYLNDEKYFVLKESVPILSKMTKLKVLHFENDNLKSLPSNIFMLSQIESLYLNNNKFDHVPKGLKRLSNLNYLDFQGNNFMEPSPAKYDEEFGFTIRF